VVFVVRSLVLFSVRMCSPLLLFVIERVLCFSLILFLDLDVSFLLLFLFFVLHHRRCCRVFVFVFCEFDVALCLTLLFVRCSCVLCACSLFLFLLFRFVLHSVNYHCSYPLFFVIEFLCVLDIVLCY